MGGSISKDGKGLFPLQADTTHQPGWVTNYAGEVAARYIDLYDGELVAAIRECGRKGPQSERLGFRECEGHINPEEACDGRRFYPPDLTDITTRPQFGHR